VKLIVLIFPFSFLKLVYKDNFCSSNPILLRPQCVIRVFLFLSCRSEYIFDAALFAPHKLGQAAKLVSDSKAVIDAQEEREAVLRAKLEEKRKAKADRYVEAQKRSGLVSTSVHGEEGEELPEENFEEIPGETR
jgi:hypothetical protein